ncbi:MAG: transglycosylase domain-containing protein [Defluviitaleaceae bacterium]|nr:transglycosylase domain-containing protein [Defluviitaleaceae bacterium]
MDYSRFGNNKRGRSPHTTRVRNKIGLLVTRFVFALVLIGGFAGLGAGMGVYLGILENSPVLDISVLGPISPRALDAGFVDNTGVLPDGVYLTSFIICSRTGEELERLHGGHNREFISLGEIPQHLIYAFVAIEDERFFEHNGIDPRGIARAIWVTTQPDRSTEGASTITQQLIKNMLGIFDQTFITKLQEQHLAINFERRLTEEFARLGYEDPRMAAKNFIIQSYLNKINLGRSNYGVQAAAWFYYNICVSEISIAQAATIASITQNPSLFPPDRRPDANWRRTQLVLGNMHRLGFITDEEFEEAMQERQRYDNETGEPMYDDYGDPIMIGIVYDTIVRMDGGGIRPIISEYNCFNDALLDQIRDDLMSVHNLTLEQASNRIFNTGLRIYSTQNMEMQAIVDRAFLDDSLWPSAGFTIEVTYQMTILNSITNERRSYHREHVVANLAEADAFIEGLHARYLGHAEEVVDEIVFKVPQPQGAFVLIDHHTGHVLAIRGIRGEKEGNRAFNRATQATRSPGSQMKPLVPFAPLIERGDMQPSTVIDDIPFLLPNPGGPPWSPGNHWSNYRGLITVRHAIYASANVVSARAASDTSIVHAGMPTMVRFLENMGVTTLHPNDGPAIVLGGLTRGMYLIELAGAYATVANAGEFNQPILYTVVYDHEGNILLENPHNPQRVLRDTTAYLLTHSMVETVTNPRATGGRANWTANSGLRGRIPIAGKTGTSQRRSDLGFVGYTPYFTAAIWMGNDNHQPLHSSSNQFHTPLWRYIMEAIHLELPARSFERPAGIVTATVCLDSGHLPTELCRTDPRGNRTRSEVFAAGAVPTQVCNVHQQHTYCTESGLLATHGCAYWSVVTRVGIVRPRPIDDITASVADRHIEFPLGVRQGLSCIYCNASIGDSHVAHGNWVNPFDQLIWDPEFGWITNPNAPPPPDPPTVDMDNMPQDFLTDGLDVPIPTPPPQSAPPVQWPGLGGAATSEPEPTHSPFVNTVPIPGLD